MVCLCCLLLDLRPECNRILVSGKSNLNEILKNYRDRAEERRKGTGNDEAADALQANNAYRAVPGDIRVAADAAQRRKQAIQVWLLFLRIFIFS